MKKQLITSKIVNTYPDHIVADGDILMFDETITSIASAIMNDMDAGVQKGIFGQVFESEEDCYSYLLNELPGLEEALQDFIWKYNID